MKTVYILIGSKGSGKSYIGKTKNFHNRYNNHKQTALNENRTNKTRFYDSFKKYNFFDYNIRILAENSLVAHQERLMDNLSLSAEERFEKLCKKYQKVLIFL